MGKLSVNIGLTLITILSLVLLTEFGLRLYYYGSFSGPDYYEEIGLREPHSTRGWALIPNQTAYQQTLDYSVKVSVNSKGLRDVEHDYENKDDRFRILILGDSFMEAYQVDLNKSLPRLLEKELSKNMDVEVINLGVGGYGTTQEYISFLEEGIKYNPDLVLLAFYSANDVRNNFALLETLMWGNPGIKVFGRPFSSIDSTGILEITKPDYKRSLLWSKNVREGIKERQKELGLTERTLFYQLIDRLIQAKKKENNRVPIYDPNVLFGTIIENFDPELSGHGLGVDHYQTMWSQAWLTTFTLLEDINLRCHKNKARFAIFTVPDKIEVDEKWYDFIVETYPTLDFNINKPYQQLDEFNKQTGISVINLLPGFLTEIERKGNLFYNNREDRHWNTKGHQLATEILIKGLQEGQLLANGATSELTPPPQ